MSIQPIAGITPDPPTATGGFGNILGGGTLTGGAPPAGGNDLQTSVDTLNRSINTLNITLSQWNRNNGGWNNGGSYSPGPGGPNFGGGGPGGTGNISSPTPFGAFGAGAVGLGGAFAQFGQNQMGIQLGLDAYVRQSQLGMTMNGGYSTNLLRTQAFGMNNYKLNALAASPMDALAMTQQLQFLAGNPLINSTQLGRAGYGAAASFGLTNPTLSGSQAASLSQQIFSPQFSQNMIAMGYGISPRALGGGRVSSMGNIMQAILRGWYNKNSVNPGRLYSDLSQGGRGYANLAYGLGVDPTMVGPVLEGYNQLFSHGLSPSAATQLFQQGKYNNAAGNAARSILRQYGVTTATSDIQALKNAQSSVTGRYSDYADSFNKSLHESTKLLSGFNQMLTTILNKTGLTGIFGGVGAITGVLSGTNHGPSLLGLGSLALMLRGLGIGGAGSAAGLSGLGGAGTAGSAVAGLGTATGIGAASLATILALNMGGNFALSHSAKARMMHSAGNRLAGSSNFAANQIAQSQNTPGMGMIDWLIAQFMGPGGGYGNGGTRTAPIARAGFATGGIVPGYQPGLDSVPAMLSRGEAVLNPGATQAVGSSAINYLNAIHAPAGSGTSLRNGALHAAAGSGPVWPFASKNPSQYRRTDAGWDLQYEGSNATNIFAVESGTLGTAGPDPNGFGISYPLLKLDKSVGGAKYIYYGHTFPDGSKVGKHVSRGEEIGHTGYPHSGGNAYNDPNWLEIGFWNNGPIGNGAAMKAFLLGAATGGGSGYFSGGGSGSGGASYPGSGIGTGGGISGIGFSEASLIPNTSELSALAGGGSGGGTTLGVGSPMGVSSGMGGNSNAANYPGGTPAKNMKIAKMLAAKYGWSSGKQWDDLVQLWTDESSWNNKAMNSSGAYGIAQSLPYTKMPKAGWPPPQGTSNAGVQIAWGLDYIKHRWNDPAGALANENAYHWYGGGGRPAPGSWGIVGDRGPELVNFGAGGQVVDSNKTADLLNGNHAIPAQGPWMSLRQAAYKNSGMPGAPNVNIHFGEKSIVINISGQMASDVSASGREIARQFIKHLRDEDLYSNIAGGEKG